MKPKSIWDIYTPQKIKTKVKAICTHCGKKQTVTAIDDSLTYVACNKCQKEGDLIENKHS